MDVIIYVGIIVACIVLIIVNIDKYKNDPEKDREYQMSDSYRPSGDNYREWKKKYKGKGPY